jgi:hypothetical protein
VSTGVEVEAEAVPSLSARLARTKKTVTTMRATLLSC